MAFVTLKVKVSVQAWVRERVNEYVPHNSMYGRSWLRKGGVSETTPHEGGPRMEFQKPCPTQEDKTLSCSQLNIYGNMLECKERLSESTPHMGGEIRVCIAGGSGGASVTTTGVGGARQKVPARTCHVIYGRNGKFGEPTEASRSKAWSKYFGTLSTCSPARTGGIFCRWPPTSSLIQWFNCGLVSILNKNRSCRKSPIQSPSSA